MNERGENEKCPAQQAPSVLALKYRPEHQACCEFARGLRPEGGPVCPVCMTALIVIGATSIGGAAAFAVRQRRAKADAKELEPTAASKGGEDGHINA